MLENDQGVAVTVTAERYQDMIRNFLVPDMEEQGPENTWFQQYEATAHTALEEIQPQMLQDVMKNALKLTENCMANRGHHLADIVFQS
ncbi:hypothetical protein GWI33_020458 [Rhynchophorus ferrugineus]|uniref:Uncharacterized protein n=1 Tax=Rhynchophorus ferrugineus TaxID=354439 RepID=A0A834M454_RHYFE|nr:hypothetical protein GWI33_020458 [Rhynchophorus ferrugineus]